MSSFTPILDALCAGETVKLPPRTNIASLRTAFYRFKVECDSVGVPFLKTLYISKHPIEPCFVAVLRNKPVVSFEIVSPETLEPIPVVQPEDKQDEAPTNEADSASSTDVSIFMVEDPSRT